MPEKITSLTQEQIDQIPAWKKKWIEIGLSTEPADFDRAEKAVLACYDLIEEPRPKTVIRAASPWAAIKQGCEEAVRLAKGREGTKEEIKEYIKNNWHNYRGAQLWASWFAYVSYFRDVCNWENPTLENFALDEEIGLTSGFVWWDNEVVAISDRPLRVSRDNGNRLHNDEGMALEYRDGWGIYAWHGFRLPLAYHWIIKEKHKITADLIEKETNAEIRRIMLEIHGFDKYLTERKAKVISVDVIHGQPRRLLEFDVAGEKIRAVEVINGTKEPDGTYRKFILGCVQVNGRYPETPHEAIAWSYGISPKVYKEDQRT
jgi:hypothetical protein